MAGRREVQHTTLEFGQAKLIAAAADGSRLIAAGRGSTLRQLDPVTLEERQPPFPAPGPLTALDIAPGGAFAVSANAEGEVHVWDLQSGALARTLIGHRGAVRAVQISADERRLATGAHDGTIRLWDLGSGLADGPPLEQASPVLALSVDAAFQTAVSCGADGAVRLWRFPP